MASIWTGTGYTWSALLPLPWRSGSANRDRIHVRRNSRANVNLSAIGNRNQSGMEKELEAARVRLPLLPGDNAPAPVSSSTRLRVTVSFIHSLHSFLILLFPSLILNKFVRWLVRFEDRREAATLPLLMTTKVMMIWRRRQKQMGILNTLSLGRLLFSRNSNYTLSILSYRLLSSSHLSNFKYLNLVN